MKLTQRKLLLETFRAEGQLYSWEITGGLHIQQYNSRISDVRKEIGCTCINSSNRRACSASEHIVSDKDNHFIYRSDTGVVNPMPTDTTTQPLSGYALFKKTGESLKDTSVQRPKSHDQAYSEYTVEELEEKKAKAEAWLPNNMKSKAYPEALKRYEAICDQLIKLTLVEA